MQVAHSFGLFKKNEDKKSRNYEAYAVAVIIIGLVARFILAPISSSIYDFSGWAANVDNMYAGVTLYQSGRYFYSPLWGYVLSFMSLVLDVLGINSFGTVVPEMYSSSIMKMTNGFVTNYVFNIVVKMPVIIFDLLTALLIYKIVKKKTEDDKKAVVSMAIWFLAPIVISSSSIFGMFESMMIFFMVLGFFFFMKEQYFLAGVSLSISVFTKFFSVLVLPVMFIYILSDPNKTRGEKIHNAIVAISGFLIAFVVIYLPVIISGDLFNSFGFLTDRVDHYTSGDSSIIPNPDFHNIFFYTPILIIAFLIICITMYRKRNDREKYMLKMIVISIVLIFSLPMVNGTPTYCTILAIPIVIIYLLYGKKFIWPWILLICFNFMYGITYYGESLFAPLFVETNLIDISTMCYPNDYSIQETISYLTPCCGILIIIIVLWDLIKGVVRHE